MLLLLVPYPDTLSKKCWDRLSGKSLEKEDVTLADPDVSNAAGQGRYRTAEASDCLAFLQVFFEENSQYYPNSHLKYLTTMWPLPEVYIFLQKEHHSAMGVDKVLTTALA